MKNINLEIMKNMHFENHSVPESVSEADDRPVVSSVENGGGEPRSTDSKKSDSPEVVSSGGDALTSDEFEVIEAGGDSAGKDEAASLTTTSEDSTAAESTTPKV